MEGAQYIIQRKLIDLPDKLENVPYLIKPLNNYKEFFEEIATKVAKRYWNK